MTTDEAMQAADEGARTDLRGYYPMAARVLAAEVRRLRRAGQVGDALPLQFPAGAKVPSNDVTGK